LEHLKAQVDLMLEQSRINTAVLPEHIRQAPDAEEDSAALSHSTVENAKRYIRNNLGGFLGRDQIAAAVFLSPDHLSHIFKKETGLSLSDYIIEQRMKKAKELLLTTNMMVSEIAIEAGYSNLPYFSKLFHRCIGVTPLIYRKKNS
jgi:two-component system response regulator YesN